MVCLVMSLCLMVRVSSGTVEEQRGFVKGIKGSEQRSLGGQRTPSPAQAHQSDVYIPLLS